MAIVLDTKTRRRYMCTWVRSGTWSATGWNLFPETLCRSKGYARRRRMGGTGDRLRNHEGRSRSSLDGMLRAGLYGKSAQVFQNWFVLWNFLARKLLLIRMTRWARKSLALP